MSHRVVEMRYCQQKIDVRAESVQERASQLWREQMNYQITALIEREGDGYVSRCPELDVTSQGDSIEEARANLQEAVALFLECASPEEIEERLHNGMYVTRSAFE